MDADRVRATKWLLQQDKKPRLLLMDDGFQHLSLQPSSILLLTTYTRPFFRDKLLPLGRLREPPSSAAKATGLVFTKCPAKLSKTEKNKLITSLEPYLSPSVRIFFSSLTYGAPVSFGRGAATAYKSILLLTGIADPSPFRAHLEEKYHIFQHIQHKDHHTYRPHQLEPLRSLCKRHQLAIFTTEKDYVKIAACMKVCPELKELPWFYVPVDVSFGAESAEFEAWLLQQADILSENPPLRK